MQELLIAVARGLVENKDAVQVTVDEPNEEGVTVFHLHVAEEDMGRVIGKQGRIAKAIRVVMRAAAGQKIVKVVEETQRPSSSVGPNPRLKMADAGVLFVLGIMTILACMDAAEHEEGRKQCCNH